MLPKNPLLVLIVQPLRGPELGAPAPRITLHFLEGRKHRPLGDNFQGRFLSADTLRKIIGAGAALLLLLEKSFYYPVFQGMIAQQHQSSLGVKHLHRLRQKFLQILQLLIYKYAEGLEDARQ